MTDETQASEAGDVYTSSVILFPASSVSATEEYKLISEKEVYDLVAMIIERADHYNALKERAVANNFYALLPLVNEMDRKFKELRKNDS